MGAPVNNEIHWRANAKTDSSSIIRLGFWSVGAVLLLFMVWACFFPLASAVITPGTFISDGRNKLVQHQRGGRVKEIFVREGEVMFAGQPILELDKAQVQASLTQLQARHASLTALKSRLDAERSGGLRKMIAPETKPEAFGLRGASPFRTARPARLTLRGGEGAPILIGAPNPPKDVSAEMVQVVSAPTGAALDVSDIEFVDSQR